jgi:hypothetical protein
MSMRVEELSRELSDRKLPGGEIVVEMYESAILEQALRSTCHETEAAHPVWFVLASLRGMGISVDELCRLAHKGEDDLLLFGSCTIDQTRPMLVGGSYRTSARFAGVSSRETRDGARLDSIEVRVDIADDAGHVGTVASEYLFKRGPAR